jgi:hypothetical protein
MSDRPFPRLDRGESLYKLIHEPDPQAAPRFRLRVNGRWIDIQVAEALLIHQIMAD